MSKVSVVFDQVGFYSIYSYSIARLIFPPTAYTVVLYNEQSLILRRTFLYWDCRVHAGSSSVATQWKGTYRKLVDAHVKNQSLKKE